MKNITVALPIMLALLLMLAPTAPADTFFPMNPGDVYTFSVSNHAGKGYYTVNSPVRTIANGKTYAVLVLFNPSGPHEEVSLLRSAGSEVFRYDGDGVETRMFMEGPAGISWNQQRRDGPTASSAGRNWATRPTSTSCSSTTSIPTIPTATRSSRAIRGSRSA